MAIGKVRPNKRSSGTSYSSTLTTIIVLGLCVYGLWMLSANNVFSPGTTTRTAAATSAQSSSTSHQSQSMKPIAKKSQPIFEDSQGDLPEDAIKPDHESIHDDHKDEFSDLQKDPGAGDSTEDSEPETNGASESSSDNSNEGEENRDTGGNEEERNAQDKDSAVKENPQGLRGHESEEEQEKQKQAETQNSQESSLTRNQEAEKTKEEHTSEPAHKDVQSQEASKQITHDQDMGTQPSIPGGESSAIPKESRESQKAWSTQTDESDNQKERRKVGTGEQDVSTYGYKWQLCNTTAGPDYIPCLDNEKAIAKLQSRRHYEHRERHCPEDAPTCLVPLPKGYKKSIEWPQSRDKIWYHNVPHTKLAEVKGHQNWVKVTGEFLTFPGGGTQFIHGALHYIEFLEEAVSDIAWGRHSRVILDVGCGVASFGGFLFEKDVLAMSFAPKDEHEAQVQFALERGIPAMSAVMGSQRLPFPSRVFDAVHCARCRVPWHVEGGTLLLELNRVLRPGGYFIWSATPLQACMHRVPTQSNERGSEWPEEWPRRLQAVPYWLNKSQMGIYGKPAPEDFTADYEHWKQVVNTSYITGLGISWSDVRNAMDMRAVYGGFAAALKDLKVWVMNVVNVDSPDTLPIIYERGLFGIYHDWCESFSTYPRTYDLLHADHLFSRLKKRCKLVMVMAEVDRLVRPGGKFIMRDDSGTVGEVENMLKSLHWEVRFTFSKDKNGILSAQKSKWRPDSYVDAS